MKLTPQMFYIIASLSAWPVNGEKTQGGTKIPSFYKDSAQIYEEIDKIQADCPGMEVRSYVRSNAHNDIKRVVAVDLYPTDPSAGVHLRGFFNAGIHSRELITSEVNLWALRAFCYQVPEFKVRASAIRKNTMLRLIIVANQEGRAHIFETGDTCFRSSSSLVDLNRNFPVHWNDNAMYSSAQTKPGPHPKSEAETECLIDAVNDFNPTFFVDLHSGNRGLWWPFSGSEDAIDPVLAESNTFIAERIAHMIKGPIGPAQKQVYARAEGTFLDYVASILKPSFALVFQGFLGERWSAPVLDKYYKQAKDEEWDQRFGWKEKAPEPTGAKMGPGPTNTDECLAYFNPTTESEFQEVLNSWTDSLIRLVENANKKVRIKGIDESLPFRTQENLVIS